VTRPFPTTRRGILRTVLLAVCVALLALSAALAIALSRGIEVNWASPWIAAQLSEALARPVSLEGPVKLTLGRVARLEVASLTLANTAWGQQPWLARAERAEVAVEAWSLWRGPVHIRRIGLEGISVLLEQSADGTPNWRLAAAEQPSSPEPAARFRLDQVAVRQLTVLYAPPQLAKPLSLEVADAELRTDAAGFLALHGQGRLNGSAVSLHAQTSALDVLRSGRDVSLRLAAQLDDLAIRASARLDDIAHPLRPLASVRISSPDAARVAAVLGLPEPGAGGLQLEAAVAPRAGEVGLRLAAQAGEFRLQADGDLEHLGTLRGLDMELAGNGPDFRRVVALLGWADAPQGAFTVSGRARSDADTVRLEQARVGLAGFRFELGAVLGYRTEPELRELDLAVSGERLEEFRALFGLPGFIDGPFSLSGKVREDDKGKDSLELQFRNRAGQLDASGLLGPLPALYGSDLRLNARGPSLARVGQAAGFDRLPAEAFRLESRLQWRKDGLRIETATLTAGKHRLQLSGQLAPRPLDPGTELRASLAGPELGVAGAIAGINGLPGGRYQISGTIRRLKDATELRGLRIAAAESNASGDGRIGDPPGLAQSSLSFDVSGKSLPAWSGLAGRELPAGPFSAGGQLLFDQASFELRAVNLSLGKARGTVSGRTAQDGRNGRFDIQLAGPDLAALLPTPETARLATDFELAARGSWTGKRWSIAEARLKATGAELQASGTLDLGEEATASAMPVSVRIDSLRRAGSLFDLSLPDLALALQGNVTGTARKFSIADLRGKLAGSGLSGEVSLELGTTPTLALDLDVEALDLAPLLGDREDAPPQPSGDRLIPDWRLPLDWLDAGNGNASVRIQRLSRGPAVYGNARLEGELRDRDLKVRTLAVDGDLGRANLQFGVAGSSAPPKLRLAGELRNFAASFEPLHGPGEEARLRRFDVDLQLLGSGATLREVAASLDGQFRLVGGPAKVSPGVMDQLYGDTFSRVVGVINPFVKTDPTVNLVCTVAPLFLKSGKASSAPTFISLTDKLNVIAYGTVDLRTERLDLNFKTEARKGIGLSAAQLINPYIKLTGTLAKPQVTLDPKGTLVSGGAAVLTAGLSILVSTAWNRAFREKDPCAAVLAEADKFASQQDPGKKLLREVERWLRN